MRKSGSEKRSHNFSLNIVPYRGEITFMEKKIKEVTMGSRKVPQKEFDKGMFPEWAVKEGEKHILRQTTPVGTGKP